MTAIRCSLRALSVALLVASAGAGAGCSSGQKQAPVTVPDAGGTGVGSTAADGGKAAGADAGASGSRAAAGRGGAGAGSGARAGAGAGGARAGSAGSAGEAGAAAAAGARSAAGGGGATAGAGAGGAGGGAGSAGSAGGTAGSPAGCAGVTPAAHPAFRAIEKLATTQDEVRILVYGQSISEQAWWSKTKSWLQTTYPGKNLVMEEHARGGCSSQCLIGHEPWFLDNKRYNRLPEDVFAWKPDLIIFHVYGDHVDYGYIMQGFKEGCDAFDDYRTYDGKQIAEVRCSDAQRAMSQGYEAPEVLVQNDFVIADEQVACPEDPDPSSWDCFVNEAVIPEQVAKYQYTLQDNFHDWPKYIAQHDLDPKTLIQSDDTHLTEPAGTDVMFALTIPHLCYAP